MQMFAHIILMSHTKTIIMFFFVVNALCVVWNCSTNFMFMLLLLSLLFTIHGILSFSLSFFFGQYTLAKTFVAFIYDLLSLSMHNSLSHKRKSDFKSEFFDDIWQRQGETKGTNERTNEQKRKIVTNYFIFFLPRSPTSVYV